MAEETLFRSVDRAVFVAALTGRLRTAGVGVEMASAGRFSQALACCAPTDTTTLYWVARTCLIHDRTDLDTFDSVFAAVFDADATPIAPRRREASRAVVKTTGTIVRQSTPTDAMVGRITTLTHSVIIDECDDGVSGDDQAALAELLPSGIAELADTPFDQLSIDDLDRLGRWLDEVTNSFATRRSRRFHRARHSGSIDLRRTLMAARNTGGEPIRLARRRVRRRPRKIVMLVDLSGSMEPFSRIYLHLMRSLVVHGDAEVFVFSTSLRRVTTLLRDGDHQVAIDRLSDHVVDRFGGTRIAASLGELVASPIWSNTVRGAVVLVASDGWDTDPPDVLERHMLRLRRMAHRIVWVNPRSAADDFAPLVGGMAAALPFVDELLSGHTLNAMRDVISSLGAGRPLSTDR